EGLFGKREYTLGINSTNAKLLYHREPKFVAVVAAEFEIHRDERAKEVTKRDINRRKIIDRSEAHVQDAVGHCRSFGRKPVNEVAGQSAGWFDTRAAGGDTKKLVGSTSQNAEKGTKYCGY